ncbi:hypothetical protein [Falsiruegeria litorea]|nr:hypothetical protein [Falsiruegeria litorea]
MGLHLYQQDLRHFADLRFKHNSSRQFQMGCSDSFRTSDAASPELQSPWQTIREALIDKFMASGALH